MDRGKNGEGIKNNETKKDKAKVKNIYDESQEEEEKEEIKLDVITKYKEAFDFFDWNHTKTIATSVIIINH